MQIDYALILSAGLGTRMGEIGKKIPKVLWPLYAKTLLELQILYCKDLGVKRIYINSHFLHDEIKQFLKMKNLLADVTLLYENPLLNSGGAIHNLAEQKEVNYKGRLLLVNGDQFLFFGQEYWQKAMEKIDLCRAVLFGITVDKDANYNETVLEDNCLKEIKKNLSKKNDYVTYSGLGLLNLNGLRPVHGISQFFETVANYKEERVDFITPKNFEYWDFGTADIYVKNIFKLSHKKERESLAGKFLRSKGAFDLDESAFVNKEIEAIDLDRGGLFLPQSIHGAGLYQRV